MNLRGPGTIAYMARFQPRVQESGDREAAFRNAPTRPPEDRETRHQHIFRGFGGLPLPPQGTGRETLEVGLLPQYQGSSLTLSVKNSSVEMYGADFVSVVFDISSNTAPPLVSRVYHGDVVQ